MNKDTIILLLVIAAAGALLYAHYHKTVVQLPPANSYVPHIVPQTPSVFNTYPEVDNNITN